MKCEICKRNIERDIILLYVYDRKKKKYRFMTTCLECHISICCQFYGWTEERKDVEDYLDFHFNNYKEVQNGK
jgi:hypothetical protein